MLANLINIKSYHEQQTLPRKANKKLRWGYLKDSSLDIYSINFLGMLSPPEKKSASKPAVRWMNLEDIMLK